MMCNNFKYILMWTAKTICETVEINICLIISQALEQRKSPARSQK